MFSKKWRVKSVNTISTTLILGNVTMIRLAEQWQRLLIRFVVHKQVQSPNGFIFTCFATWLWNTNRALCGTNSCYQRYIFLLGTHLVNNHDTLLNMACPLRSSAHIYCMLLIHSSYSIKAWRRLLQLWTSWYSDEHQSKLQCTYVSLSFTCALST